MAMMDHLWRQVNRTLEHREALAVDLRQRRQRIYIDADRHGARVHQGEVDKLTAAIGDTESRASAIRLMIEADLQELVDRVIGEAYGRRPR